MSTIRVVYRAEPNFPASDQHPDAVRYPDDDQGFLIDGRRYWVDAVGDPPTIEDVEAFLGPAVSDDMINAERERRIAMGCVVTLQNAKEIPVQTRDQIDFRNLSLLNQIALEAKLAGSEETIPFRDADDTNWDLTPSELVEMISYVAAYGVAIYKLSWALKAMDPRPANYADDQFWTPPA